MAQNVDPRTRQEVTKAGDEKPVIPKGHSVSKRGSETPRVLLFSVLSGVLAAMAGTFGKIAFSEDILDEMKFAVGLSLVEAYDVLILQATFVSLTIVTNVVMMGTFLHALSLSATTIYVTATNTAANFLTTAFLGYTFFNEQLTTRWFFGISLILAGISILTKSKDDTEPKTREKKQKEE